MLKERLKNSLGGRLPVLVFILVLFQPLMDIASYWLQKLSLSTAPVLLVRFGVLGACLVLALLISSDRKIWAGLLTAAAVFTCCHIAACCSYPSGYQNAVSDLTNLVRIFQLPLMTGILITYMKENGACFRSVAAGCFANMLLIAVVEALAFAADPLLSTYSDGTGYIGWFFNTNSQSAILCCIVPIAILWGFLQKKRFHGLLFGAALIAGLLLLYFFGTRLTYFGIFVVGIGWAAGLMLIDRSEWKTALAVLLLTMCFVPLFHFSQLKVHRDTNARLLTERQASIQAVMEEGFIVPEDVTALSDEEYAALVEKLTPVYEKYVSDFCEYFGAEKTMEMFGYSTSYGDFSNVRQKKILFAQALMEDAPLLTRLFGLELGLFTVNGNVYDVENDFYGIYYLSGIVGLTGIILFIGMFAVLILWALLKNARYYFTPEALAFGIALALCLAHAVFTAGVLRRPNASFYLSVILAGVWYLVKIRPVVPKTEAAASTEK